MKLIEVATIQDALNYDKVTTKAMFIKDIATLFRQLEDKSSLNRLAVTAGPVVSTEAVTPPVDLVKNLPEMANGHLAKKPKVDKK